MVDVTTAVKSAARYLKNIENILGDEAKNLRLEEVEKSEDMGQWLITLGYDVPTASPPRSKIFSAPASSTNGSWKFEREYKLFHVNAETGEVESMKIRKV
ncbi:MAG: hypothetical protein AAFP07_06155 [Cyanobacteria bacterium J06606_4]